MRRTVERERERSQHVLPCLLTDLPRLLRPGSSVALVCCRVLQLKEAQRELEFLRIQEEYIKDESKHLKRELLRAKEEVKRIQSVPLTIGQFIEMIDDVHGIVSSTAGQNHYVRILSTINRELLKPNSSVALHRYSNSLVDTLPNEADSAISMMQMTEKPDTSYADIGGLDIQKQEIREAVELPLTHFQLYRQIGIDPPRGVLLYGPPVSLRVPRLLLRASEHSLLCVSPSVSHVRFRFSDVCRARARR